MRNTLASSHDSLISGENLAQSINWRGQSGRYYTLAQQPRDSFKMSGHDLYVVAKDNQASWTGTADDLIVDQASRARFRHAMKVATSVLRLEAPADDVERMKIQWDLEGGQLAGALCLVS